MDGRQITLVKNSKGNYDVSFDDLLIFNKALRDNKFAENFINISGSGVFAEFTDENFNSCSSRSSDIEYRKISTCCETIISGFACNKKKIFNILPQDCHQCLVYQKK